MVVHNYVKRHPSMWLSGGIENLRRQLQAVLEGEILRVFLWQALGQLDEPPQGVSGMA
jgi:hypothetical protein